jgi:glucose/arabinose dehydrogenase
MKPSRGILMIASTRARRRVVAATVVLSASCAHPATLSVGDGVGPTPELPPPRTSLIPTVKVSEAKGWPMGAKPTVGPGLTVRPFATDLDHPRWLYVLPNGDVLVAETNAPPRPDNDKGIRGWFIRHYMKKAGAVGPSANRITLLRDADGDGVPEARSVLLDSLNSPFGMVVIDHMLYVANTDGVVAFPYTRGQMQIAARGVPVAPLPAGTINHHWTKNIIASADGRKLYATVGSNSNAGENGINDEDGRAAVWEIDLSTGKRRMFASGLRNPVGLAWEPTTGALWVSVAERDELGSDLVPDYITALRDGAFYGFPFSYFGQHLDPRVKPQRPDLVAHALVPDYALGPHTASLGLAWSPHTSLLPPSLRNGMIVSQHGSWNRKPQSGYKVIFVPFENGKPSGPPVDVVTGFLGSHDDAMGRPVGVAFDKHGGLLIADDVGNTVWRVTAAPTLTTR